MYKGINIRPSFFRILAVRRQVRLSYEPNANGGRHIIWHREESKTIIHRPGPGATSCHQYAAIRAEPSLLPTSLLGSYVVIQAGKVTYQLSQATTRVSVSLSMNLPLIYLATGCVHISVSMHPPESSHYWHIAIGAVELFEPITTRSTEQKPWVLCSNSHRICNPQ